MKTFKTIDFYINVTLILGLMLWVLLSPSYLFTAYLIAGSWQVFSMLIHRLNGWFMQPLAMRSLFHWLTSLILSALLISTASSELLLATLYLLLFTFPFLALIYCAMCYAELRDIKKRYLLSLR